MLFGLVREVKTVSGMFKCRVCGSTDFNLAVRPGYAGKLEVTHNEEADVIIVTDQREFIADLMFMNQFAVCICGEIKTWEYFYPKQKA